MPYLCLGGGHKNGRIILKRVLDARNGCNLHYKKVYNHDLDGNRKTYDFDRFRSTPIYGWCKIAIFRCSVFSILLITREIKVDSPWNLHAYHIMCQLRSFWWGCWPQNSFPEQSYKISNFWVRETVFGWLIEK